MPAVNNANVIRDVEYFPKVTLRDTIPFCSTPLASLSNDGENKTKRKTTLSFFLFLIIKR